MFSRRAPHPHAGPVHLPASPEPPARPSPVAVVVVLATNKPDGDPARLWPAAAENSLEAGQDLPAPNSLGDAATDPASDHDAPAAPRRRRGRRSRPRRGGRPPRTGPRRYSDRPQQRPRRPPRKRDRRA